MMARSPSCYLHFSFVLHLVGVSSLLAGYSTPHWTLVKFSTGEVWAMGLVVSCYKNGSVFVIVFGMCTATILLSVFVLQVSCLAICNRSCRAINVGTGLSYFSFLIALSIGVTLALYQLDLAEERKPGVTSITIGWSRYSVIGSSLAFLLGALLNIADYMKRNRFNWWNTQGLDTTLHLNKRADVRNKMVEITEGNNYPPDLVTQRVEDSGRCAQRGNDSHFKGERMAMAVVAAMKSASGKSESEEKSLVAGRDRAKPNTNVILVNEAAPKSDAAIKNMGKRLNERTGSQSQHSDETRSMRKIRLVRAPNVDSTEAPKSMPEVEEESAVKFDDNDREQRRCHLKGEVHNSSPKSIFIKSSTEINGPVHFKQVSPPHPRPLMPDAEVSKSSSKYVIAAKKKSATLDEQDSPPRVTTTETEKCELKIAQQGRRGSRVEDALLSVSRLLEDKRSSEKSTEKAASRRVGYSIQNDATSPADNSVEKERVENVWNQKTKQLYQGGDGDSTKKQTWKSHQYRDKGGFRSSKDSQRSVMFEKENDVLEKSSDDDDSANDNGTSDELHHQKFMTEEQMKRFQILEAMSKEKKRKRILETSD